LGVRINRVRSYLDDLIFASTHKDLPCGGHRGRGTRTSSDALNRSSRTKRNTSSLVTNRFYAQSSRYPSVSSLFWLLTSLVMVAGPRLRQARPHQLPVRQGLSSSYPHRIERAADANSNDLAAERKAKLAPRCAHNQRSGGNPPAVALVRRGRDDILGDA
jgi:hypothetical protein